MTEKETGIKDLPGVGPATAQKLEEAGYNNLISIAVASPRELIEASGLTENAARKVINTARKSASLGFESGSQLLEKRAKVIKLTTGSKAFDALMEGGFESGAITECYGQFGSAKCIDKDTPVFYFNPEKPHLDSISEMYTKYKMLNGEVESDGGHVVTLDTVSVISLTKDGLKKTKASHLYKMHAKNIYEIKADSGQFHNIDDKKNPIEPPIKCGVGEYFTVWGGRETIDNVMRKAKIGQKVKLFFAEEGEPKKKGYSGFKLIKGYLGAMDEAWLAEQEPSASEVV